VIVHEEATTGLDQLEQAGLLIGGIGLIAALGVVAFSALFGIIAAILGLQD